MEWQQWLADAQYWHWAVAGICLLILEAFAPGAIFMWLGISALVVAIVKAIIPIMGWELQWFLFAIFSIVSIIGWRIFFHRHPLPDELEPSKLNQRGKSMIGQKYTLSQPIENGQGRVQIGDSWWRIEGSDLPAGSSIVITGSKGSTLTVAQAD